MRPTSAFYKKMGLGMFSVGKSSFLSEINLGAFAENFGFEARYGEIKIVSSGDCFALEKSDTYSVDLQNENWKIVGYQTAQRAKLEHDLLVVPSTAFHCPGFLRLSYCVSHDMILRSLPAFRAIREKYQ